jgi:outer membrane protein TolC
MPSTAAVALPARGASLRDCYRRALKTSADVIAGQEAVREARGNYLSAFGTVLPHVSYDTSYTRQAPTRDVFIPSYLSAEESYVNKFTVNQAVFSGFREFAAVKAARGLQRQRILQLVRTQQVLLGSISDAFYTALEQRETGAVLAALSRVLEERIADLRKREQVGRSRRSDVVSTLALFHQNEADRETARNQEMNARAQLEYLTGVKTDEALRDDEAVPLQAEGEQVFASRAAGRPDVGAAREALFIARRQVTIARADFWPTVSLSGDYYTRRTGTRLPLP